MIDLAPRPTVFPPTPKASTVLPLVAGRVLAAARLPEPYRTLLAHEQDMTSTLERFHGEPMALHLLAKARDGGVLERRVVLVGQVSGKPREYGAIRIYLELFPAAARRLILAGRRPLGAVLALCAVPYVSEPEAFLELESSAEMRHVFDLQAKTLLFGRRNVLRTPAGEALAEVLEILPPGDDVGSG